MFGTLGGPELLLIFVVALIVFGPRKLPEIGKSLGRMLVEFRRASTDFKRTIEGEIEAERHTRQLPESPAPGSQDRTDEPTRAADEAAPPAGRGN